jgi:hypothetical protein
MKKIAFGNGLLCLGLALSQSTCAQTNTVEVTGRRPVAKAVERVEAIYGWPITYEDPIVANESRLEDAFEGPQNTPYRVQKKVSLSFTYRVPLSRMTWDADTSQRDRDQENAVADALTSVLAGYSASGGPETFAVSEEGGMFHVVPQNFLTQRGTLQQLTPILDTKITILPKPRTRPELVDEICSAVSRATGIHVGVGSFPEQGSESDTPTTISGSNVTARSLLNQLLNELSTPVYRDQTFDAGDGQMVTRRRVVWSGGPMSWELYFAPDWGYDLNVYKVKLDVK